MNRRRSSRFPRPWSSHLIEELVDLTPSLEGCPYLVNRMVSGDPLAQEDALLPELEFHRSSGEQSQPLSHLDRNGNLAFGRDGTSHEVKNISPYREGQTSWTISEAVEIFRSGDGALAAKKKTKALEGLPQGPFRNTSRRRPTLPRTCARSTIGAEGLNCRVRNGNGCFPLATVTGKLEHEKNGALLGRCSLTIESG